MVDNHTGIYRWDIRFKRGSVPRKRKILLLGGHEVKKWDSPSKRGRPDMYALVQNLLGSTVGQSLLNTCTINFYRVIFPNFYKIN